MLAKNINGLYWFEEIVCWRAFNLAKAICSAIKSLALRSKPDRSDMLRGSENCKAGSISNLHQTTSIG